MEKRWRNHKYALARKRHHSPHLQNAWDKYAAGTFKFMAIIQLDNSETPEVFDSWENFYIQTLRSCDRAYGYNVIEGGHGCSEGAKIETGKANKIRVWTEGAREKVRRANSQRKWSEESRKKISESVRALPPQGLETREKKRIASTGRTHSEETKEKIREGNKGKVVSEETRKKISESGRGHVPHNKGKLGHKMSAETKMKMVKSRTGLKRGPYKKKINNSAS